MEKQIEKQAIEEMAKVIERTERIAREFTGALPSPTMFAKDLYWHGYRKQKKGFWKIIKPRRENRNATYICSVCGGVCSSYYNDVGEWKFCPKCGAKMKGGE